MNTCDRLFIHIEYAKIKIITTNMYGLEPGLKLWNPVAPNAYPML